MQGGARGSSGDCSVTLSWVEVLQCDKLSKHRVASPHKLIAAEAGNWARKTLRSGLLLTVGRHNLLVSKAQCKLAVKGTGCLNEGSISFCPEIPPGIY